MDLIVEGGFDLGGGQCNTGRVPGSSGTGYLRVSPFRYPSPYPQNPVLQTKPYKSRRSAIINPRDSVNDRGEITNYSTKFFAGCRRPSFCYGQSSILVGVGSECLVGPAAGQLRMYSGFRTHGFRCERLRPGWNQVGVGSGCVLTSFDRLDWVE